MEKRQERASGIELLRILCMLMIIAHHYFVHGGFSAASIAVHRAEGMAVQMMQMFGRPACLIFALISGYFLVERGRERHVRRVLPLVAEQWFYSVLILVLVLAFHLRSVSALEMICSLVPALLGHWYIVGYLMLYVLIPFLNPWLRSMEKRTYRRLLLALFIIWSVIPTCTLYDWHFDERDLFPIMYLTGGYIRLHGQGKYPNGRNLAASLLSAGTLILSVALINTWGYRARNADVIGWATYFGDYNSTPGVVFAVSTFLFFSRLRFTSRTVNYLAGSVIGIYLIHDDDLVRDLLWKGLSPNAAHLTGVWVHAPVKILAVFVVCLAVDLLRRATVEKVFLRWFCGRCAAWDRRHETEKVG